MSETIRPHACLDEACFSDSDHACCGGPTCNVCHPSADAPPVRDGRYAEKFAACHHCGNHSKQVICPACGRERDSGIKPLSSLSRDSRAETLAALKNSGIDTSCGACMEVAFTGVTTNAHTCKRDSRAEQVIAKLASRIAFLEDAMPEGQGSPFAEALRGAQIVGLQEALALLQGEDGKD